MELPASDFQWKLKNYFVYMLINYQDQTFQLVFCLFYDGWIIFLTVLLKIVNNLIEDKQTKKKNLKSKSSTRCGGYCAV